MSTSISMCRSMCIFMCIFMCILMSMSMSISIYISMSIPVVLVGGRRRSGGRHLAGALPPPPVTNHPLSSPPEPSSRTCESRVESPFRCGGAGAGHARARARIRARTRATITGAGHDPNPPRRSATPAVAAACGSRWALRACAAPEPRRETRGAGRARSGRAVARQRICSPAGDWSCTAHTQVACIRPWNAGKLDLPCCVWRGV